MATVDQSHGGFVRRLEERLRKLGCDIQNEHPAVSVGRLFRLYCRNFRVFETEWSRWHAVMAQPDTTEMMQSSFFMWFRFATSCFKETLPSPSSSSALSPNSATPEVNAKVLAVTRMSKSMYERITLSHHSNCKLQPSIHAIKSRCVCQSRLALSHDGA